jgi:tetratricopeptide (TPR) repeat protein
LQALTYYKIALNIFRFSHKDWENEARTLLNIASAYIKAGRTKHALDVLKAAHTLAIDHDDCSMLGRVARQERDVYIILGFTEQANFAHQRSLKLGQK